MAKRVMPPCVLSAAAVVDELMKERFENEFKSNTNEKGPRAMKTLSRISAFVALLAAFAVQDASAGLCGLGSYSCCPAEACTGCGDYAKARGCCAPAYRTVKEIVWEQQKYTCTKTVYDQICETCPVTCYQNVYQTCYRDECYSVCRPVYRTCYRNVNVSVCKPCFRTCYRNVCCKVRRPIYQTCYRNVSYTVCRPCYRTCYKNVCYTVCKPVYRTCYRNECCTTYRTHTQTCYKDVCYTVCKPVCESKCVNVCTGEWRTTSEYVPGPVVEKCVRERGTWEYDCCGACTYKPGKCCKVKVQCPGCTI